MCIMHVISLMGQALPLSVLKTGLGMNQANANPHSDIVSMWAVYILIVIIIYTYHCV